jgi:hypothetical protein
VRAGIRYERLRKELVSLGSEVVTVDYNQPDSLRKVRSRPSKGKNGRAQAADRSAWWWCSRRWKVSTRSSSFRRSQRT